MVDEDHVRELLRLKDGYLFHREGQELEFKEQFNLAGLADYFRDFAAFANNRGGYLIFGIRDSPRTATGLSETSLDQFNKIDPEKITGFLLEIFSTGIEWEQATIEIEGRQFGVFRIDEAHTKPVIAKRDEGKDQIIKNGDIYYRYGGRTQRILSAELQNLIFRRVEQNNQYWLNLISKIAKAGPQNAAILDTERALIAKDDTHILLLDDALAEQLKFVKEGDFVKKKGATTLRLVGDVVPVDKIEVVRKVKENLLKEYPLSAMELALEVKKIMPQASQNDIWQVVKETHIKENRDYSAYNFRNKKQEDFYSESGRLPVGTPSIYNQKAAEFVVSVLKTGKTL